MTTLIARQPKGIPVGGQFAATTHAEPGTALVSPATLQTRAHDDLTGNALSPVEESRTARAAIDDTLTAGGFGDDTARIQELAVDDRLVRLAVDRYVVTDAQDPDTVQPADAGQRLGQYLMELHAEDVQDADNLEDAEARA